MSSIEDDSAMVLGSDEEQEVEVDQEEADLDMYEDEEFMSGDVATSGILSWFKNIIPGLRKHATSSGRIYFKGKEYVIPDNVDPAQVVDMCSWSYDDVDSFYDQYKASHMIEWDTGGGGGLVPMTYAELEDETRHQRQLEAIGLGKDTFCELYQGIDAKNRPANLKCSWGQQLALWPWERGLDGLTPIARGQSLPFNRPLMEVLRSRYNKQDLRDFVYDVYADVDEAPNVLAPKLSGKSVRETARQMAWYDDVIDCSDRLQLAVKVVTLKDMSIQYLKDRYLSKVAADMSIYAPKNNTLASRALAALDRFGTKEHLRRLGAACIKDDDETEGGVLKNGTTVLFKTLQKGQLQVQVIPPAPLAQKRVTSLGIIHSHPLAKSVISQFIGHTSFHPPAQIQTGISLASAAHGLHVLSPPDTSAIDGQPGSDNEHRPWKLEKKSGEGVITSTTPYRALVRVRGKLNLDHFWLDGPGFPPMAGLLPALRGVGSKLAQWRDFEECGGLVDEVDSVLRQGGSWRGKGKFEFGAV